MAPKQGRGAVAKAKAAAAAAAARKVEKKRLRRAALQALNTLAEEVGAGAGQVDSRSATPEEVERAIYVVQARCRDLPLAAQLRHVVQQPVTNGGKLQAELAPFADLDDPSAVPQHKALLPEFRHRYIASRRVGRVMGRLWCTIEAGSG